MPCSGPVIPNLRYGWRCRIPSHGNSDSLCKTLSDLQKLSILSMAGVGPNTFTGVRTLKTPIGTCCFGPGFLGQIIFSGIMMLSLIRLPSARANSENVALSLQWSHESKSQQPTAIKLKTRVFCTMNHLELSTYDVWCRHDVSSSSCGSKNFSNPFLDLVFFVSFL